MALVALAVAGCGGSGGSGKSGSTGSSTRTEAHKSPGLQAYVNKQPEYAKVPESAPVKSGTVDIAYRNFAIDPDTVKVRVGATVKWTNYDPSPHNVVSESGPIKFASKQFGEGRSFSVKMTRTGVIHYECTLQPTTMNGTIEVVE